MLYGYNKKPVGRIARARISRVNCSFKDLCEVCRNVRYKDTDFALEFLGNAAEGKQAIYFARHNKKKGHRRELGGKKGGFPVKSCRAVLGVVESADANAIKLGLGATKIAHIAANKHATYPRMSPKGRRIRHDYEVAFIEVVLEEKQQKIEKKDAPKDTAKKADVPKTEAKKTDVKTAASTGVKAAAPQKIEEKKAVAPQKSN
ncbi:MAG: 50S ribosomal protein L22 [Candidatus Micrarchaeia archaeon]|jgi:large subunit ribosomal protein L22